MTPRHGVEIRCLVCEGSPAHDHELPLRGPRPRVAPQVHGENGAGAVEDGRQRGHERRDHHSHHQPPQACRGARTDSHPLKYTHGQIYTRTRSHTHILTYTRTHTNTHARIRTLTRAHTFPPVIFVTSDNTVEQRALLKS